MQINLSNPSYTGISDACIQETGKIVSQCNQYAGEVSLYFLVIGILIGAVCMFAAMWWYRGNQS